MPFLIVRNDIVNMQVDAVVNTANPQPVVGCGVDAGVHKAAGPQLLEARRRIGYIPVGQARITPGFGLKARYVIHAVGPVWDGGGHHEVQLSSATRRRWPLRRRRAVRRWRFRCCAPATTVFPKSWRCKRP